MRCGIPLMTKERFLAVMASRSYDGKVSKGDERHLLYSRHGKFDKVKNTWVSWKKERTSTVVRKLLAARENHPLYGRAQKFVDAAKKVNGFSSGIEARRWMEEWALYGRNWNEKQLIFYIDAKELAETLTDEQMEARILAESL